MLLLCHDLSCLICPLKTFPPAGKIHLGATLHVPAVAVKDLEVFKKASQFESSKLLLNYYY